MRRPGGPFRFFRCSIEAMVWLNPVQINDAFDTFFFHRAPMSSSADSAVKKNVAGF